MPEMIIVLLARLLLPGGCDCGLQANLARRLIWAKTVTRDAPERHRDSEFGAGWRSKRVKSNVHGQKRADTQRLSSTLAMTLEVTFVSFIGMFLLVLV